MLSLQDIDNIVLNGGIVVDVAGEKIGSVEQVFTSGDSGNPVFVTVRTGLLGMSESFAPLSGASLEESVIRVAFAKDAVKSGPRIDSDRGAITEAQEQELYSYYGLDVDGSTEGSATGLGPEDNTAAREPSSTQGVDAMGKEGLFIDPSGARSAERPPRHPLPPDGPPPPPQRLRKHVPPRPHPGPQAHPPLPHGPGEPGPIQ